MARVPAGEAGDRLVRALFWTLVYHLEPEKWDELTRLCGAFGPDEVVLAEMRRVTARGGWIALISPESPDWFEEQGWRHITAPALPAPDHPPWIDEFFGPLDPPHELVMVQVG